LREYANKYRVGPGWTFLTGARGDMEAIRRKLGFYDNDPVADADPLRHSGMLRIGREASDRWMMMPAQVTPRQLVSAIRGI
jgi:protein SCO1/2